MTQDVAPTKDQLAQWDKEDQLNWTRAEFEIPNARKCGAKVGEYGVCTSKCCLERG